MEYNSTDAVPRERSSQQQMPPSVEHQQKDPSLKRRRILLACSLCRARKSRCDGARPRCSTCEELDYDCTYVQSAATSNVLIEKSYLTQLEHRLKSVEESVATLQSHQSRCHRQLRFEGEGDVAGRQSDAVNALSSNETQVNTLDPRDHIDQENDADGMGAMTFSSEEACGFYGPTSNIAFTRHISRAVAHLSNYAYSPFLIDKSASQALQFHSGVINISRPPSPSHLLEQRNGAGKRSERQKVNIHALPSENRTREIISDYFQSTGLLFPYIYEPQFWETYETMKADQFTKVRRTWLGLLNIIMALSTSISKSSGSNAEERIKESHVYYQRASELCDPQIMRGGSLELVQYLLVAGQYLQGTQKSVETWTIHGLAVKMAFQLGLHSPDASLRFSSLEREIRKRTWYGCILLDRTLSMTFGRPAAIPEDYVRIELPCHFTNIPTALEQPNPISQASLTFFNSTVKLYRILWNVINVEYAGNIGVDNGGSVFDIVSRPLQLERTLVEWERQLPPNTGPFRSITDLPPSTPTNSVAPSYEKFRVVLTLRYLNLRVLLHRPVLVKFLEATGVDREQTEDQELKLLMQIGASSLQSCVESACDIISLAKTITHANDSRRAWLGAWWFSLYYTFNAALVICAALLIQHNQRDVTISSFTVGSGSFALQTFLFDSIAALRLLDSHNKLVERCVLYLVQLVGVLESLGIGFPPGYPGAMSEPGPDGMPGHQQQNSFIQQPDSMYSFFPNEAAGNLDTGVDLGEFMLGGDIDLLNQLTRMAEPETQ